MQPHRCLQQPIMYLGLHETLPYATDLLLPFGKAYKVLAGLYSNQVWSSGFLRKGDIIWPALQTLHLNFSKGTLLKRSTPNWVPPWYHLAICTLTSLSMLWGTWAGSVCTYARSGILHLAQCKWPLWQGLLCCCSKWGVCSYSLSRLVCVFSQREVLVPFFRFCQSFSEEAPCILCLAYSDCLWFPFSTAQQSLPFHLGHYGLFLAG